MGWIRVVGIKPFSGACCFVTVLRSVSVVFFRQTLFHAITRSAPTVFCSSLQSSVNTTVNTTIIEGGWNEDSLGTLLQIICSAFFTRYPIQKLAFMLKNRVSPHLQLFMRVGMFLNGFIKLFTEVDHNPDEFVGL